MYPNDNLKKILLNQKQIISELETEITNIENSDLSKENIKLKKQLEDITSKYEILESKAKELSDNNKNLKSALIEQIQSQKNEILNNSNQKIDIYFESTYGTETNRLSATEKNLKNKINNITAKLKEYNISIDDEFYPRLEEINKMLEDKIDFIQFEINKNTGSFSENAQKEYDELRKEDITDEQIKAIAKKNNIENFIGLNIINKIGIFLIIVGVIAFSRYTYTKLPDIFKSIIIFIAGVSMLLAGEFVNRKKANVFSLGLTAGGVAVLYAGLTTSYFALRILSVYPAIILCILITLVSFILSTRYNSQIIAIFAFIGGYLPIFSLSGNQYFLYGLMVYFVVLNFLALSISFSKKWTVASYIGLILNTVGSLFILIISGLELYSGINFYFLISYLAFTFTVYVFIPILSSYKTKERFKISDVILIALNTFFSSSIIYLAFYVYDKSYLIGLISIIFALIYLLIAKFIESKLDKEKNMTSLFYLTGFAFLVLTIPLQFGVKWLSMGWLAEGIVLLIYGILTNQKLFKKSGAVIYILCISAFIYNDLGLSETIFIYRYFIITLSSILILIAIMYKNMVLKGNQILYKNIVLVNTWIFLIYFISNKITDLINHQVFDKYYLSYALCVTVTFFYAYIIPRISILRDKGTKTISIVLNILSIIFLFLLNYASNAFIVYSPDNISIYQQIIALIILIITCSLSIFALYDVVKSLSVEGKIKTELVPIIISSYFLIILTENLIIQYGIEFTSVIISIIYVITAFLLIIFGFIKSYTLIRRFGLGLAVLSIIKLFLLDLYSLTKGFRIISYFALGITLLAISFVYQKFSKNFELKGSVLDDKKDI